MRRREFIVGLAGAAAMPEVSHAQQTVERMRRIGVLMAFGESDPQPRAWLSGFMQGVAGLGWIEGRNVRIDVRWGAGNIDRMRMAAKELVDLQPDVILSNSTPATASLHRETQTIPIVFVAISDPVGAGFVRSLSSPGGNITGFGDAETAMMSKWLELLTEIAPGIKRVVAMFNPDTAAGGGSFFLPPLEIAAQGLKVELITARVHSDVEIEGVITSLGREPGGGLIVVPDGFMVVHRGSVIALAARNKVPAIYWQSLQAKDGGLLSYGPDYSDLFRRAALYVDRILRGAKASDLPVQLPTKFEMAVNVRTAKALGLTVPPSILLSADEVIE